MNHVPKQSPSISHDTSKFHATPSSSDYTSNLNMAPGSLLDHDTKVYYFKQYRQFWASGPAAAVAVIAGVCFSKSTALLILTLNSLLSRMSRLECNRKYSLTGTELYPDVLSKHFSSAFSAAKFVYQYEGIRGFWAGTSRSDAHSR